MSPPLRETATGFTRTGEWLDVVEHGERISCALIELNAAHGATRDSVVAWEHWRPKAHERLRRDVGVRTADHTSGRDSHHDPRWRRILRRAERSLYLHVMTLVSPYYFDTALLHASISRRGRPGRSRRYHLDVSVADDALRARMRELLAEYETTVPRWHLAAVKATDTAVAAEGHDLSPGEVETGEAPLQAGINLSQARYRSERVVAADD